MNRMLVITLFFALLYTSISSIAPAAFASENDEVQVWTFEIDDEEDFEEDLSDNAVTPEILHLKVHKEVILDEITSDYGKKTKYKADLTPNAAPFLYPKKDPSEGGLSAKTSILGGDFSLQSTSRKTKNDYLKDTLNQRTEAKYSKKHFEVSTGYETKYENPDASMSTKNIFLAPKIKLTDEVSVIFNNKVDSTGTKFEQEVGLNFKPKFLPHSIFGVSGGTTIRNDSGEKTQKMKFNTDLLLW